MRRTEQRRCILEAVKARRDHPTAYDVYECVRKTMPGISLGTVYRNLDFYTRQGLLRTIESGGDQKRYDFNTEDHPHFRCIRCGAVEDLPMEHLPDYRPYLTSCAGERIVHSVIFEVVGLCSRCAEDVNGTVVSNGINGVFRNRQINPKGYVR